MTPQSDSSTRRRGCRKLDKAVGRALQHFQAPVAAMGVWPRSRERIANGVGRLVLPPIAVIDRDGLTLMDFLAPVMFLLTQVFVCYLATGGRNEKGEPIQCGELREITLETLRGYLEDAEEYIIAAASEESKS